MKSIRSHAKIQRCQDLSHDSIESFLVACKKNLCPALLYQACTRVYTDVPVAYELEFVTLESEYLVWYSSIRVSVKFYAIFTTRRSPDFTEKVGVATVHAGVLEVRLPLSKFFVDVFSPPRGGIQKKVKKLVRE
jgi:hypothetical protein